MRKKVFITYSLEDKKIPGLIANEIRLADNPTFFDAIDINFGDPIFETIDSAINDSSFFILIINKNSLNSDYVRKEINSISLKGIADRRSRIICVKTDDSPLPAYLSMYEVIDLTLRVKKGLIRLRKVLEADRSQRQRSTPDYKSRNKQLIEELSASLKDGKLTLVCGAGVSVDAGIPAWDELLIRLLDSMLRKLSNENTMSLKNIDSNELRKRIGSSALVVGKYLKSNLGKDFCRSLEKLYMPIIQLRVI